MPGSTWLTARRPELERPIYDFTFKGRRTRSLTIRVYEASDDFEASRPNTTSLRLVILIIEINRVE